MKKAIDNVIADPAAKYSCTEDLLLNKDSVTSNQSSENNSSSVHSDAIPVKMNPVKPPTMDPVPKPTEHVFSGTLNNCTINIFYK